MKFVNHMPSTLDPNLAIISVKDDFEPTKIIEQTMSDSLFMPLDPTLDVTLTVNGQDVTKDNVTELIGNVLFAEHVDSTKEHLCKEIFEKGLGHFSANNNMLVDSAFVVQAAISEKLPLPDATTIYTPTSDVIPVAKELLMGACSVDKWTASLCFFAHDVRTFAMTFADQNAFDKFKEWVASRINSLSAALPPETVRLFADFDKLNLNGLTESIILRKDIDDGNEEFSFPRMIARYAAEYTQVQQAPFYCLTPFSAAELAIPTTMVFINLSAHSQATSKAISLEWQTIAKAINSPTINMVSNKTLRKLTAATRNASKLQGAAASARQFGNSPMKSANIRFSAKAPNTVDLTKLIRKVMQKMSNVACSQNSYKIMKTSFMRPNRRDPDNYNLTGKTVSTAYKPDIHLYLDTSGSISEAQYEDVVKACIVMARKLNINMYFNSFSHVLSQCTLLPTKGRSVSQIYRQFQHIPKVDGGTDYQQIWEYIQASPKRRQELSLLITDFEYTAPNKFVEHPTNLYYAPCSNMYWNHLVQDAQAFVNSMQHIEPNIRARLLM